MYARTDSELLAAIHDITLEDIASNRVTLIAHTEKIETLLVQTLVRNFDDHQAKAYLTLRNIKVREEFQNQGICYI